jgi:hypothetical protein
MRPRRRPCRLVLVGSIQKDLEDIEIDFELSRRKLLAAAGIGGVAVAAPSFIGTGGAEATSLIPPHRREPH